MPPRVNARHAAAAAADEYEEGRYGAAGGAAAAAYEEPGPRYDRRGGHALVSDQEDEPPQMQRQGRYGEAVRPLPQDAQMAQTLYDSFKERSMMTNRQDIPLLSLDFEQAKLLIAERLLRLSRKRFPTLVEPGGAEDDDEKQASDEIAARKVQKAERRDGLGDRDRIVPQFRLRPRVGLAEEALPGEEVLRPIPTGKNLFAWAENGPMQWYWQWLRTRRRGKYIGWQIGWECEKIHSDLVMRHIKKSIHAFNVWVLERKIRDDAPDRLDTDPDPDGYLSRNLVERYMADRFKTDFCVSEDYHTWVIGNIHWFGVLERAHGRSKAERLAHWLWEIKLVQGEDRIAFTRDWIDSLPMNQELRDFLANRALAHFKISGNAAHVINQVNLHYVSPKVPKWTVPLVFIFYQDRSNAPAPPENDTNKRAMLTKTASFVVDPFGMKELALVREVKNSKDNNRGRAAVVQEACEFIVNAASDDEAARREDGDGDDGGGDGDDGDGARRPVVRPRPRQPPARQQPPPARQQPPPARQQPPARPQDGRPGAGVFATAEERNNARRREMEEFARQQRENRLDEFGVVVDPSGYSWKWDGRTRDMKFVPNQPPGAPGSSVFHDPQDIWWQFQWDGYKYIPQKQMIITSPPTSGQRCRRWSWHPIEMRWAPSQITVLSGGQHSVQDFNQIWWDWIPNNRLVEKGEWLIREGQEARLADVQQLEDAAQALQHVAIEPHGNAAGIQPYNAAHHGLAHGAVNHAHAYDPHAGQHYGAPAQNGNVLQDAFNALMPGGGDGHLSMYPLPSGLMVNGNLPPLSPSQYELASPIGVGLDWLNHD